MIEQGTITLGGLNYTVGPFNLGQLKAIGIGSIKAMSQGAKTPAEAEEAWYDGVIEVIGVAIGKTNEEMLALSGVTRDELIDSSRAIYKLNGLLMKTKEEGGKPLGEAPA